jgi:magnesium chelatase subunit I
VTADAVVEGFRTVPSLLGLVELTALAPKDDAPVTAAACELILESLVARRKISRTDAGLYGRSHEEKRRRPYSD